MLPDTGQVEHQFRGHDRLRRIQRDVRKLEVLQHRAARGRGHVVAERHGHDMWELNPAPSLRPLTGPDSA